ncbi:MAG: DUF4416 family protein [bacterium]
MDNSKHCKIHRESEPVKYITAITFNNTEVLKLTIAALENQYSRVDVKSPPFKFDHTQYYKKEMGSQLMKQFFSFVNLDKKENLVHWKLFALELENQYAIAGKRQVNIDPAYLELAKLVVSSSKNFDHRIYLGQGIYGDVQLRYRNRQFVTNDWTYPDYCSAIVINFVKKVRNIYFQQLKQLK